MHAFGGLAGQFGDSFDGIGPEQPRAIIDPCKRQPAGVVGVFGLEYRLQPGGNFARAFDGNEQGAAVAGDRIIDECEAGHDRSGEIEAHKRFVSAPLAADQTDAGFRQQPVDQPGAHRCGFFAVPAQSLLFLLGLVIGLAEFRVSGADSLRQPRKLSVTAAQAFVVLWLRID